MSDPAIPTFTMNVATCPHCKGGDFKVGMIMKRMMLYCIKCQSLMVLPESSDPQLILRPPNLDTQKLKISG